MKPIDETPTPSNTPEPQTGQHRGKIAREEILTAAIECLLAHGYAATTTMKVQEHAGVSRGEFLYHFPSRRALITATVRHLAAEFLMHERTVLRRVRESAHTLYGEHICAEPRFTTMLDVIFTSMRGMAMRHTFSGRNSDTEPMLTTWTSTALTLLQENNR